MKNYGNRRMETGDRMSVSVGRECGKNLNAKARRRRENLESCIYYENLQAVVSKS